LNKERFIGFIYASVPDFTMNLENHADIHETNRLSAIVNSFFAKNLPTESIEEL